MQRLVLDLDGTITEDDPALAYPGKRPNRTVVAQVRANRAPRFTFISQSARTMRSYAGTIGQIAAHTLPVIIHWLRRHEVPHDEIHRLIGHRA